MFAASKKFSHMNQCLFGSSSPSYRGMWLNPIFIFVLGVRALCGVCVTTIFNDLSSPRLGCLVSLFLLVDILLGGTQGINSSY
jgi:hypothetical protein